jgi:hypothetical protein
MSYSLGSLFKIRTHKDYMAQIELLEANRNYSKALDTLSSIKNSLDKNQKEKVNQQNVFFLKSKSYGCTNNELKFHLALHEKLLKNEQNLKVSLKNQEEKVSYTAIKLQMAKGYALITKRNLKIIENHHAAWAKKEHRQQLIKEEYKSDDFNCIRYCLNNQKNEKQNLQ